MLSDTASESTLLAKQFDGTLEPLVKIIPITDQFVVAFAGNAAEAHKILGQFSNNLVQTDAINLLRLSSFNSETSEFGTDYILNDNATGELFLVRSGRAESINTGYIGSKEAFENYQRYKQEDESPDGVLFTLWETFSEADEKDQELYSSCMQAFRRTVQDNKNSVGGFVVPYVVSDNRVGFADYHIFRRNSLTPEDIPNAGVPTSIISTDPFRGNYDLQFWGQANAFAAYFSRGKFGVVFSLLACGSEYSAMKFTNTDGYDFSETADRLGCGRTLITNWGGWKEDYQKCLFYIDEKRVQSAGYLVRKLKGISVNFIQRINPGFAADFTKSVFAGLKLYKGIRFNIEAVNIVSAYLDVSSKYSDMVGDFESSQVWKAELSQWEHLSNSIHFEFHLGEQTEELS